MEPGCLVDRQDLNQSREALLWFGSEGTQHSIHPPTDLTHRVLLRAAKPWSKVEPACDSEPQVYRDREE
jgi:hypothetical protein